MLEETTSADRKRAAVWRAACFVAGLRFVSPDAEGAAALQDQLSPEMAPAAGHEPRHGDRSAADYAYGRGRTSRRGRPRRGSDRKRDRLPRRRPCAPFCLAACAAVRPGPSDRET